MDNIERSYGIIPIHINKDTSREYLVILRTKGHWEFPKGHKEGAETPLEAAKRELREETGIANCNIISSMDFKNSYTYAKDGVVIPKEAHYAIGITEDKHLTIQEKEVADFAWLSPKDALERLSHDGSKKILQEAEEYFYQYEK